MLPWLANKRTYIITKTKVHQQINLKKAVVKHKAPSSANDMFWKYVLFKKGHPNQKSKCPDTLDVDTPLDQPMKIKHFLNSYKTPGPFSKHGVELLFSACITLIVIIFITLGILTLFWEFWYLNIGNSRKPDWKHWWNCGIDPSLVLCSLQWICYLCSFVFIRWILVIFGFLL